MEKKESFLLSPEWWISVVVAGILINLIAAYMKPMIDKWVAQRSNSKKIEVEQKEKESQEIISQMVSIPTTAIELRVDRTRSALKLILYIVAAIVSYDMTILLFRVLSELRGLGFYIPREIREILMILIYFILLIKGISQINFMRRLTVLISTYDKKTNKSWLN